MKRSEVDVVLASLQVDGSLACRYSSTLAHIEPRVHDPLLISGTSVSSINLRSQYATLFLTLLIAFSFDMAVRRTAFVASGGCTRSLPPHVNARMHSGPCEAQI